MAKVCILPALRGRSAVFAATLLVAGCAPAIDTARPVFSFAAGWQGPISGAPRLMDERAWWKGLRDPVLDALVLRGLSASPTLAAARARAEAADRAARAVPGAVALSGGLGAQALGGSLNAADHRVSGDLGLEILFDPGRGRAAARLGAGAEAAVAQAELAAARLLLVGRIAESYLALRHAQERLRLAGMAEARQRQTLDFARSLAEAGEGTRVETLRSEARLAGLRAARPGLQAAVTAETIRLGVLAGDAPGAMPGELAAALERAAGQPRARMAPDPGVPADLVRNRPDLMIAEARYDGARAAVGQARAALYPRLSLGGTIELRRTGSGGNATTGDLSGFGPSLRLPVLPQAAARANIAAAEQRVIAAHADWTAAVLNALGEVETALLDYRAAARAETATAEAVRLHAEAQALTRTSVADGAATLSDLIAIEDALADAEGDGIDARLARAQAYVRLNLRLGNGARP